MAQHCLDSLWRHLQAPALGPATADLADLLAVLITCKIQSCHTTDLPCGVALIAVLKRSVLTMHKIMVGTTLRVSTKTVARKASDVVHDLPEPHRPAPKAAGDPASWAYRGRVEAEAWQG